MREILEHLLQSVDVPNVERAQLHWDEYRSGAASTDPAVKAAADAAFATLLAWYGASLYRHIWGFIRTDAAEDVFQEVLRKLHEKRTSPRLADFHANVLPWLRTVAIRECVDAHRRARRRHSREAKAARPEKEPRSESRDELQEVLAVALARLTPDEQQAIALHYFEGHDRQQTAAILGVHRDTVATRLSTALERLQKFVPMPATLLVGSTVSIPSALALKPPVLTSTRLAELVANAWADSNLFRWSMSKVAAMAIVGLTFCGAVAAAGWTKIRENEPELDATGALATNVTSALMESVPDRNLRFFYAEVKPRQLPALKRLLFSIPEPADVKVELESVIAHDTRLTCKYLIRHQRQGCPEVVFRVLLIHDTMDRRTDYDFKPLPTPLTASQAFYLVSRCFRRRSPPDSLEFPTFGDFRLLGTAKYSPPQPGIGTDLSTLDYVKLAFHQLPQDERTIAELKDHTRRVMQVVTPMVGTWYVRGDRTMKKRIRILDHPRRRKSA